MNRCCHFSLILHPFGNYLKCVGVCVSIWMDVFWLSLSVHSVLCAIDLNLNSYNSRDFNVLAF